METVASIIRNLAERRFRTALGALEYHSLDCRQCESITTEPMTLCPIGVVLMGIADDADAALGRLEA